MQCARARAGVCVCRFLTAMEMILNAYYHQGTLTEADFVQAIRERLLDDDTRRLRVRNTHTHTHAHRYQAIRERLLDDVTHTHMGILCSHTLCFSA